MASQLEIKLQQRIQVETDVSQRASFNAELACYLARTGDFERADDIRSELRRQFGNGSSLVVSVRLMVLEGLLMYYKDLNPSARDRILRANLLSNSFHELGLIALTSAWLAHIDFNRCSFQSMVSEIRKCMTVIDHDDGTALCRVSLVLGDSFLHCGDRESSQVWYEKARLIATDLGDQAAIGAITYNRAALNVQNLRLRATRGAVRSEEVERVRMELKTAINYQNLARLKSLDHLLRAATVSLHIMSGEYDAAIMEASNLVDSRLAPEGSGEHLLLLSDLAICYASLGDLESALRFGSQVVSAVDSCIDEDDLAIIFSSLAESAKRVGKNDLLIHYNSRASQAISNHDSEVAKLNRSLDEFRSGSPLT